MINVAFGLTVIVLFLGSLRLLDWALNRAHRQSMVDPLGNGID